MVYADPVGVNHTRSHLDSRSDGGDRSRGVDGIRGPLAWA